MNLSPASLFVACGSKDLLNFLMPLLLPAEFAKLLQFQSIRRISFIFLGRVVLLFAFHTGHCNDFTHNDSSLLVLAFKRVSYISYSKTPDFNLKGRSK